MNHENYENYLKVVYQLRCDLDGLMSCSSYRMGKPAIRRAASDLLLRIRRIEEDLGIAKDFSVYAHLA